jgi:hypothetical protein
MNHIAKLFLTALAVLMLAKAYGDEITEASGIHDACNAGALLDKSGISYKVVVFQSSTRDEAGCIYDVGGVPYLYTPAGSAKVNMDRLADIPLERVPRSEVLRISDGDRDIENGCLVFATCAYAEYKRNPHITWAGIIAAQIVNVSNLGYDGGEVRSTGHAITAFEDDHRRIFIAENGDEPRELDQMTQLAQAGDRSWHDSSALVYCDHHIQGITSFKDEFGRPR